MNIKRIICLSCILTFILVPTVLYAIGREPEGAVHQRQLAVIRQLESNAKLTAGSRNSAGNWELYSSDDVYDTYRDVTAGHKVYEFWSGTTVLRGMMDYTVCDWSSSKQVAKSEEELIGLAKEWLAEIYGENFNNYTYESIEYWNSDHLYHVTFWRYIKGYKIDDPIGVRLTGNGDIISYNARARGVYDNFDIDPKEVAAAKEELLAEAEQRWQRPMEILDYFLMYNADGQKVAVLTVLFDSPEAENMKWTDWLDRPIC